MQHSLIFTEEGNKIIITGTQNKFNKHQKIATIDKPYAAEPLITFESVPIELTLLRQIQSQLNELRYRYLRLNDFNVLD